MHIAAAAADDGDAVSDDATSDVAAADAADDEATADDDADASAAALSDIKVRNAKPPWESLIRFYSRITTC